MIGFSGGQIGNDLIGRIPVSDDPVQLATDWQLSGNWTHQ